LNELWLNISKGDKDAYSQLYVIYYKKLFGYGRKFTEDIPLLEDAIQEVLMVVWTHRDRLTDISNPNAYYFTSFRNVLFKKMNEAKPDLPTDEHEFSIDTILIKQEVDDELKEKLQKAIRQLTPRQAEAIYLRFYEGLSYEEVAGTLDISVKATYKIMARALLQLKTALRLPYLSLLVLLRVPHLFPPG
jgi:RNA polymerase sigma factor (sigma-70 family)